MATGSVQTPERVRSPRVAKSPKREIVEGHDEPVLLKSFLHKKGKRFKGWHQRYFEIQGKHMYYYKNSSKSDCLGEIDLSLCTSCGPSNEATFGAPFEIKTTLRTHVISTRSLEERDQWIEVIRNQSKTSTSATTNKDVSKPKRWQTFKSAFGKNQRHHRKSQDNLLSPEASTTSSKGRTIFGRFKRKTSRPTLRAVQTESNLHNDRPLSMLENSTVLENLGDLLDAKPCHSLPATPLTRRRSNPTLFSHAGGHVIIDPMMTLPANLPSLSISAPGEYFENSDDQSVMELMPPPHASRNKSLNDTSGDELTINGEIASLDTTLEAPASPVSTDTFGSALSSVVAIENGDVSASRRSKSVETEDSLVCNEEIPTGGEMPPIIVSSPVRDRKPYVIKDKAWEDIRMVLSKESDETRKRVVPLSYDVLPKQEQPWKNMSSGIEGLRVFLDMSDS